MKDSKEKVATTKVAKNEKKGDLNMKNVKPNVMVVDIKDIKESFGKCAILIKGNMVYRTSTQTLEKGPQSLLDLYLPNYGKMRKFIVLEDGVYEIATKEEQSGTAFAKFEKLGKVNIDASKIDFNIENAWNYKKVEKAAK